MDSPQSTAACGLQAQRLRLDLVGEVQGVGFRPFVHRLANAEQLAGLVRNTGSGISIEIEGTRPALERFLVRLDAELPPHAAIHHRDTTPLSPQGNHGFFITPSATGDVSTALVMADLATCAECLREISDPADRRYRYPFNSCVHCGPRYSIIEELPYDRVRTTMRHFPLCTACQADYLDPTHRRFHAESIACPDCGPQIAFRNATGQPIGVHQDALMEAVDALRGGMIVALKGLGGFQLLVDAANEAAVDRLRVRKRRPRKPFALMVPSLRMAEEMAEISDVERRLLTSPEAPIVLLRARPGTAAHAPNIAPDNPCLGIMLPYTPLHHLLLQELAAPVVATSGNRGDEPIIADETKVLEQLGRIADCYLIHDRPIRRPIDDSVVRVMAGRQVVLRRARGYASKPFNLPAVTRPVVAFGGQQKAAVALGFAGRLLLGAHIGDLTAPSTRVAFAQQAADLPGLYRIDPAVTACDTHPDYHSTRVAVACGRPVAHVPHHLAHVLAGMIDNGLDGPVLGVAWDGTGYGGDGTIWGGEFLAVDDEHFRRVAHLRHFRLPGNEVAVREPRRAALGLLHAIRGESGFALTDLPPVAAFAASERAVIMKMLNRGANAPLTSSAGRLFDATAALLGLCQVASFEGEGAMAVEFAADRAERPAWLPPAVVRETAGRLIVDWQPLMAGLIDARIAGEAPEPLAAALHDGLAEAIVDVARYVGLSRVVLTGGCFQNARLTERTVARLRATGLMPYWHHHIPPNDGGLAAGQIAFAARPLIEETM
jgi:hydrogenase maturation protein HypF